MFNKKRQCCCNTPVVGPTFVECFPKIPINSSEKTQTGTYSFWIEIDIDPGDLDDSFNFGTYRSGSSFVTNSSGVPDTGLQAGPVSLGDLKSTTDDFVFIPQNDIVGMRERGSSTTGFIQGTMFGGPIALFRRGWKITTSSRVLSASAWAALDEHRQLFTFPLDFGGLGARRLENISGFPGFIFKNTFTESPTLTFTGPNLTWEYDTALAANVPATYGFVGSGKKFYDFTHHFPSTITLNISGTTPIAYGDGTHTNAVPGTQAPKYADVSLSGSIVLNKVSQFPAGGGVFPCVYEVDASASSPTIGSVDVQVDDGSGNITTKTIEILNQTTGSFPLHWQGRTETLEFPGFPVSFFSPITCTTDIGYQPGLNGFVCSDCNPNSGEYVYGNCSPKNYPGSSLGRKNCFPLLDQVDESSVFQDNTVGFDYVEGLFSDDLPLGYSFQFSQGCANFIEGLDIAPVFTWGKATNSAVTVSVEKPSSPGLSSYLVSTPDTACSGGVFPPLVDFFFNGPEPPILSGSGTVQIGPFPTQALLFVT
mgnify:CR=1 FL=1